MKSRLGSLAVAAGSLLSVALIGCNPPIDEPKKPDTPVVNPGPITPSPAPVDTKPTDTSKPFDTTPAPAPTPAVEPPKIDNKPADATPTPKDESKKEETPKSE